MIYNEEQLKDRKCKEIDTECSYCKNNFLCERRLVQRALREKKEKYCSHRCGSLAHKKERIELVCSYCGDKFERLESASSDSANDFCSHRCSAKHYNRIKEDEKIKSGTASIFICMECGMTKRCNPYIRSAKKFCSHLCKKSHTLKKYKILEQNQPIEKELKKVCLSCKEEFNVYPPSDIIKRKYCSGTCRNKENNKILRGFRSKAEFALEHALNNKFPGEEITFNNRTILNGLELDVYFPKLKLAIEWNGVYHYKQIRDEKSFIRTQTTDIKKQQLCLEQDITLLVIKDLTSNKNFIENEICNLIKYIEDYKRNE